jgi:hypothetical protein
LPAAMTCNPPNLLRNRTFQGGTQSGPERVFYYPYRVFPSEIRYNRAASFPIPPQDPSRRPCLAGAQRTSGSWPMLRPIRSRWPRCNPTDAELTNDRRGDAGGNPAPCPLFADIPLFIWALSPRPELVFSSSIHHTFSTHVRDTYLITPKQAFHRCHNIELSPVGPRYLSCR